MRYGRQKRPREHWLYVLPAVVVLAVIVVGPTIFLYWVSLTTYELGTGAAGAQFVGLENYVWLLGGRLGTFWRSLSVSLRFMVGAVSLELVLGLALALLFNGEFPGKRLVLASLVIPLAVAPSIVSLMWKLMYNTEYGVLNYLLGFLGLKVNWLGYEAALLSTILVDVWQWTPFMALIIYAGLQALPQEPLEAASVDGATPVQTFFHVVLPLLGPILSIALALRCIDALKLFDLPYGLTQGGPGDATELLSLHIYRLGFQHTGWIGIASANGVLLLLLVGILTTFMMRVVRRLVDL